MERSGSTGEGLARPPLARRVFAEWLGSLLLAAVVVGSGIAAERLSPDDIGLQLLENAVATAAGLVALILMFGPVSGAHFNPVVTIADRVFGGIDTRAVVAYLPAQVAGCCAGTMLANVMFADPVVSFSEKARTGLPLWTSEVVATTGLLLVVFAVVRSGRAGIAPFAVGAYIGAAYFWTSSTSFANPAITIGRMLSDTFAGIRPSSAPAFVVAQLLGLVVGVLTVRVLYPDAEAVADDVVLPPNERTDARPHEEPDRA